METGVIPISIYVHSHPLAFPFPSWSLIPIPMALPWDSRSYWESNSRGHLYDAALAIDTGGVENVDNSNEDRLEN